jgi:hypothetical protein
LRALNSVDVAVTTTSGAIVLIKGTTVEQPAQSLGGGLNSALVVALPAPLGPNASVSVQFVFGVQAGGRYRFLVNVEALTSGTASTKKIYSAVK